jgi:hypothetical protein
VKFHKTKSDVDHLRHWAIDPVVPVFMTRPRTQRNRLLCGTYCNLSLVRFPFVPWQLLLRFPWFSLVSVSEYRENTTAALETVTYLQFTFIFTCDSTSYVTYSVQNSVVKLPMNQSIMQTASTRTARLFLPFKVKLSLCFFNWAPRQGTVWGESGYSSTHSWPRR